MSQKEGIKTQNKSLMQTCSELTLYKSGSGISDILPSSDWDWTKMSGTPDKQKPKPYASGRTSWTSRKFRVRCKIQNHFHLQSRRSVLELIWNNNQTSKGFWVRRIQSRYICNWSRNVVNATARFTPHSKLIMKCPEAYLAAANQNWS